VIFDVRASETETIQLEC